MNLRYSKKFVASFRKLSTDDKRTVIHALELFQDDPFHPSLRNHAIRDKMSGKRSIAVNNDLRIVFTEHGQDVTLLAIGTHAEVYRQ